MKTNVTGPPVAEKSFFTASLLRILAILLIVALSILSSCTNVADKADISSAQNQPITSDYAYQYNEPESPDEGLTGLSFDNTPASVLTDAVAKQEFAVKNKKDTTIVGSKGIKVLIPKNCFDLPNPNAEVKIELKEYTTAEDFFFANLTTGSDGRLLESGGTIYINATSEGRNVSLKKGQKLSLAFPTGKAKPKPGMQTFYGVKESDGTLNWKTTEYAAITVDENLVSDKNIVTWKSDWVDKIVLGQKISLLTGRNYQVQAYGSNNHCTRFTDTTNYKNVLEYFKDKFKVDERDLKQLKDSYIIYTYRYWNGAVFDVTTALEFHSKKDDSKQLKEAVKRVKASIGKLIKGMPKGENTKYPGKEVIRFYFNNFAQFEALNYSLDINDNKVSKSVSELVYYPDTMSLGEYTAYIDSIAKAKKAQHDSLMANNADYYMMNTGKLGWINCDRFYDNSKPKGTVIARVDDVKPGLTVKLIFKDILSVMNMYGDKEGSYTADKIPVGERVKVMVVDKRKDGMYYAVKDGITGEGTIDGFEFKPMTVEAVKKELAGL
jgi:hypothetical protein